MSDFEKSSWNQDLQRQLEKAVEDLKNLYLALDDLVDQIEAQQAFVKLLAELLKPPS